MNIVHKTGINHRKIYLFGSVSLSCVCTDQCFCLSKFVWFFLFFYFSIFLFFIHISICIDINIFLLYNFQLNNTTAFCLKNTLAWLDCQIEIYKQFDFFFFCSSVARFWVILFCCFGLQINCIGRRLKLNMH